MQCNIETMSMPVNNNDYQQPMRMQFADRLSTTKFAGFGTYSGNQTSQRETA